MIALFYKISGVDIMSVYIIDYENVKTDGFDGVEKLLDDDVVIVFYSVSTPTISIKSAEKVLKTRAKFVFKEANVIIEGMDKVFHDALDAQLDTYAGYLIGKHQDRETQYYIISKDRGFDFVCKFWENRGFKMSKISRISDGNVNERIEEISERVKKELNDEQIAAFVTKAIINKSTKGDIHQSVVDKYGQEEGNEIYKKIKPLIKNKNDFLNYQKQSLCGVARRGMFSAGQLSFYISADDTQSVTK